MNGQREVKGFLKKKTLCAKTWETAQSNQQHLRIMTGLLTGQNYLKVHLFKQGLANTAECDSARLHLKQPTFFVTVGLWPP
jgi:hypothetical protein